MMEDNKLTKKNMPFITQGKTNLKYILIVVVLAVIVGGGILGYYYSWIKDLEAKLVELESKLPEIKPSVSPTLDSITPSLGSVGTTITLHGKWFTTSTPNDVTFRGGAISFQGRNMGYINNIFSQDGTTLTFTIPEGVGACAKTQMKPGDFCPLILLLLEPGHDYEVYVINKNGTSNAKIFQLR